MTAASQKHFSPKVEEKATSSTNSSGKTGRLLKPILISHSIQKINLTWVEDLKSSNLKLLEKNVGKHFKIQV
jgi:hypothetical protein